MMHIDRGAEFLNAVQRSGRNIGASLLSPQQTNFGTIGSAPAANLSGTQQVLQLTKGLVSVRDLKQSISLLVEKQAQLIQEISLVDDKKAEIAKIREDISRALGKFGTDLTSLKGFLDGQVRPSVINIGFMNSLIRQKQHPGQQLMDYFSSILKNLEKEKKELTETYEGQTKIYSLRALDLEQRKRAYVYTAPRPAFVEVAIEDQNDGKIPFSSTTHAAHSAYEQSSPMLPPASYQNDNEYRRGYEKPPTRERFKAFRRHDRQKKTMNDDYEQSMLLGDAPMNTGRSQAMMMEQRRQVMLQDSYQLERTQEISAIQKSIHEMGKVFNTLASMVHSQGEALTRIDDNLEATELNIMSANDQLLQYLGAISSSRSLIIKTFVVVIFFLFLFFFTMV